jgi:phosphohistidine phosphatase SixA
VRALLVRHARAGERKRWSGDDRARPLDEKGRRQAEALAPILAELGADALLSSPYLRCVESLEPAGRLLGLRVETRDELAEGSPPDGVLALLDGLAATVPALCTHGDVVDALLPGRGCRKGAVWVVDVRDGEVRPERYLPPA